ncbi:triple gene block 3 protein [Gaillardia latent virus]|uniref:Movement protein TGBp3 n=1 Tax=Gaillardia latent virus TaxID=1468172 RepID=X2L006_9VIRU|nr:triple gene block 3 protein [Gaillardia latent virus]AHN84514.1 triple gene block 3 protein [Gaillardia latent virus]
MLNRIQCLILVTSLVVSLCIVYFRDRNNTCVVVITGESVKIVGCEFTDNFVEFAKVVKPAGVRF